MLQMLPILCGGWKTQMQAAVFVNARGLTFVLFGLVMSPV